MTQAYRREAFRAGGGEVWLDAELKLTPYEPKEMIIVLRNLKRRMEELGML